MEIERRTTEHSPKRVLLVGWDAADWQMIHPLIEQGLMPTTAKFLETGAWGNLATTRPILSPMLWNTIATGKRPQEHGVLGFTEVNAEGTEVQPVASTSRKCKALWNILTQCGLKSNVVGWYASHPAEPIAGVMVSNRFEQYGLTEQGVSPVAADCIHPPELSEQLAQLRVLPSDLDASAILPFIPRAAELLHQDEHKLGKLQHLITQTSTIHAVATELMASTEWDFTAIYYEGIDRFGHEFMEFHPPKMDQVSQQDFEIYQHCMVGIYRFHDMLLETLLKLAGEDTAVILMSDHGYFNDHLRPDPRPGKAGPVEWHRPFGILAAQGQGIATGSRLYGASILDVAPTVLHLLGLPVAHDMPGRVLAEVLTDAQTLSRIESWEEIEGSCGMHAEQHRTDPAEARAMLDQLAALGYIDPPSEDTQKTISDTLACNHFNLIQSLIDSNQHDSAIQAFEKLDPEVREETSAKLLMAACCLGTERAPEAREILESLISSGCDQPRVFMMLGTLEYSAGNTKAALDNLDRVAQADARLPGLHSKLGGIYLDMGQYERAIESFEKALEIDADSPVAYAGLARARLNLNQPELALELGLVAAELVHFFPRVHLTVGEALFALGDVDGAVEALELCVKQAPKLRHAHKVLAKAYGDLGETEKAKQSELRAKGLLA